MDGMSLEQECRRVLAANHRVGSAELPALAYDYTCPSPDTYPFQWCWDSAFHAIVLARLDPRRAQREITSLLAGLQPDGFLPHILLWPAELRSTAAAQFTVRVAPSGWHTLSTHPPVLPVAVERVWSGAGDDRWLDAVLPRLIAWFDWWTRVRDPDGTGLVSILQPDESGLDMSPKYDRLLGIAVDPQRPPTDIARQWHDALRRILVARQAADEPFVCQDVLVNTIYAHSALALARLLEARGRAHEAEMWRTVEQRTRAALVKFCWDEARGAFFDTSSPLHGPASADTQSRVFTATSLLPLVLPGLDAQMADRLVAHLVDPAKFWLPYPVPSVAADEPTFDADFATEAIFRGSSWVNLNWYLHQGLLAHGRHDIAVELAARTRAMIERSGLRECYGPRDGAGHGAHEFGWSTLVLDLD